MKDYFKKFEDQLQVAEEKLDILSEWHIAKGHNGATEIAEDCRTAITSLWIEFHQLSEAYKKAEASHEEIVKSNVEYLLGEMKRHDEKIGEILKRKPNYILFDTLDKVSREVLKGNCATAPEGNIEQYLLNLIKQDFKKRGISK
ncbi:hypothetical protein ACQRDX_04870 [Streptococcus sp. SGI.013]|uniref:hypothetical protein n=1 Tax=unclassified Streptococcus TaxID=2608887 RepID=UPI003D0749C1